MTGHQLAEAGVAASRTTSRDDKMLRSAMSGPIGRHLQQEDDLPSGGNVHEVDLASPKICITFPKQALRIPATGK